MNRLPDTRIVPTFVQTLADFPRPKSQSPWFPLPAHPFYILAATVLTEYNRKPSTALPLTAPFYYTDEYGILLSFSHPPTSFPLSSTLTTRPVVTAPVFLVKCLSAKHVHCRTDSFRQSAQYPNRDATANVESRHPKAVHRRRSPE